MLRSILLDKNRLNQAFELFSGIYKKNKPNKPLDIYVVGGSAVVLNFEFRLSTMDIDALFETDEMINNAIMLTAKEMNIASDWLNSDFINTPSFTPKIKGVSALYKTFNEVVNVYYIEPLYLVAMKLKSARPTGGDLDDVIKMIYELRYNSKCVSYEDIVKAYFYLYEEYPNEESFFINKTKEAFETSMDEIEIVLKKKSLLDL